MINKFSFISPHVSRDDNQGDAIAKILLKDNEFKDRMVFAPCNLVWDFYLKNVIYDDKMFGMWILLQYIFKCWVQETLGVACDQSWCRDDILLGSVEWWANKIPKFKNKVWKVSIVSYFNSYISMIIYNNYWSFEVDFILLAPCKFIVPIAILKFPSQRKSHGQK